jgi:hypothetical protein
MPTIGEQLLLTRHLGALNRLRRIGSRTVKLGSERAPMKSQVASVLAEAGIAPEKRAEIYKKILLKAKPVTPGVIPKESGVPPTSSHAPGLRREAGKIRPGQDDTNPKLAQARDALKSAMLMPMTRLGTRMPMAAAKELVQKSTRLPSRGAAFKITARDTLGMHKSRDLLGPELHSLIHASK